MIFVIAAILSAVLLYLLSSAGYYQANLTIKDIVPVLLSLAAFYVCPYRKFEAKILALFSTIIWSAAFLWNILIDFEFMPVKYEMFFFFGMCGILGLLYTRLAVTFDSLPVDEIREGYIYRIVSKPKSNIQWVGFLLTLGKGGSFAWTNGKIVKKFRKLSGKVEIIDFDESFLNGKKVIEVGPEQPQTDNVGKRWGLFNSCTRLRW